MSADPKFTLTCDNETGDLAEEVRMAASLVKLFEAWKREAASRQRTRPSAWAFWGPWTSSNARNDRPFGKR